MRAEQLVLELREILVRFDENLAAHTLMQSCVPYFLDDASHPSIARARAEQAQMVDHIVGDSYAHYYETNHHERPFEEQYECQPEDAHERLHRVRFLRRWLLEQQARLPLNLLDCACNDGWMAKNLEGLVNYTGVDLNPHCIERAKSRGVGDASFSVGFAEDVDALHITKDGQVVEGLQGIRSKTDRGFDVVVAYELIEHVRDPAALLEVMASTCEPGGSLFVSTPLGAGTGGELRNWWYVEPKGHVRAYTPQSFADLLSPHGETHIEISDTQGAGQLMVARVDTPAIVEGDASQPVRADRAGRKRNPRPPRGSASAKR